MTAPASALRKLVEERDEHQCVACGHDYNLEFQHRQASGMGGRGKKAPALTAADGMLLCRGCNQGAEAAGQKTAIERGWKVRRNSPTPNDLVPVFYTVEGLWYLLNVSGTRSLLSAIEAWELRVLAGIV
jgi:hypothetical protein